MALHLLSGSVKPYSVSKTGVGRVHRLLGTSMKAKFFCREDVLNAYDRVVGNAEVRPVSLTNGK